MRDRRHRRRLPDAVNDRPLLQLVDPGRFGEPILAQVLHVPRLLDAVLKISATGIAGGLTGPKRALLPAPL
jgi:hypothetical protein